MARLVLGSFIVAPARVQSCSLSGKPTLFWLFMFLLTTKDLNKKSSLPGWEASLRDPKGLFWDAKLLC